MCCCVLGEQRSRGTGYSPKRTARLAAGVGRANRERLSGKAFKSVVSNDTRLVDWPILTPSDLSLRQELDLHVAGGIEGCKGGSSASGDSPRNHSSSGTSGRSKLLLLLLRRIGGALHPKQEWTRVSKQPVLGLKAGERHLCLSTRRGGI